MISKIKVKAGNRAPAVCLLSVIWGKSEQKCLSYFNYYSWTNLQHQKSELKKLSWQYQKDMSTGGAKLGIQITRGQE